MCDDRKVRVVHPHSFARQSVEMRRQHFPAVAPDLLLHLVVVDEKDNIWSIARSTLIVISLLSRCANREH